MCLIIKFNLCDVLIKGNHFTSSIKNIIFLPCYLIFVQEKKEKECKNYALTVFFKLKCAILILKNWVKSFKRIHIFCDKQHSFLEFTLDDISVNCNPFNT